MYAFLSCQSGHQHSVLQTTTFLWLLHTTDTLALLEIKPLQKKKPDMVCWCLLCRIFQPCSAVSLWLTLTLSAKDVFAKLFVSIGVSIHKYYAHSWMCKVDNGVLFAESLVAGQHNQSCFPTFALDRLQCHCSILLLIPLALKCPSALQKQLLLYFCSLLNILESLSLVTVTSSRITRVSEMCTGDMPMHKAIVQEQHHFLATFQVRDCQAWCCWINSANLHHCHWADSIVWAERMLVFILFADSMQTHCREATLLCKGTAAVCWLHTAYSGLSKSIPHWIPNLTFFSCCWHLSLSPSTV